MNLSTDHVPSEKKNDEGENRKKKKHRTGFTMYAPAFPFFTSTLSIVHQDPLFVNDNAKRVTEF